MAVLVMRLEAPMQSWGTYSRFTERDTGAEPSKSGVIGLICAAMGRRRDKEVSDLAALKMAVRVEREGTKSKDYHTAMNVPRAGNPGSETVPSNRYYLADACFLVMLEGEESTLISVRNALQNPDWGIFLGRKSFPPSAPILFPNSLQRGVIDEVVHSFPWVGRKSEKTPAKLRAMVECDPEEGEPRMDVPESFAERKFRIRYVKNIWIPTPAL